MKKSVGKDFEFGICMHYQKHCDYSFLYNEEYIKLAKEMGMTCIRCDGIIESEEDLANFDEFVELCQKYNMEIMWVLGNLFADGVPGRPKWDFPDGYTNYANFVASRYKGKVKYYQLLNETPDWAMKNDEERINRKRADGKDADGLFLSDYNKKRLDFACDRILAYEKGIRQADPDAKTVVNFSWWHVAGIEYYLQRGCTFDVIGMDWYSNAEDNCPATAVMDYLFNKFPEKQVMVCESNKYFIAPAEDEEEQESKWCIDFAKKLYSLDDERLLGVIFYELVDDKRYEKSGNFTGEAHLGFIRTDKIGKPIYKKKVFNDIKEYISSLR